MKKSLFAIAALAVAGLGFMGCDEVLETCGGVTCEAGKLCADTFNAGEKCVASIPPCSTDQVLSYDADDDAVYCVAETTNTCTDDSGCEEGYICDDTEKVCVEGTREELNEYTYVRIDDLTSPNVACCGKETCSNGCTKDDPGADIDAIALVKADNTVKYATTVVGYANAFLKGGDFYKEGNTMALDQNQVLGEPDSFKTYGGATGNPADVECHYTNKIISEGEPAASDYTFASLGGEGGYIIVQMDGKIEAGDKLDVLEVGDCKLINKSGNVEGKANKEEVKVQISINAEDGSWKTVIAKAQASNGLISSTITEDTFK